MSENKPTQSGDASDPLSTLHRMSTTAGASSQEYVAVNLMAVAALALGLASALVLLTDVLLVIPLAALASGILALRQIRRSSGTQTGRVLVVLGMLIGLGFGTFIGVRAVREYNLTRHEQAAIETVVGDLGQRITAKDFAGTLGLFSDGFLTRKKITPEIFAQVWRRSTQSEAYGNVTAVSISRVVLSPREGQRQRGAGSMLIITFERSEQPLRREIVFRKMNDRWKIDDIPMIFPSPPPEAPEGARGAGMAPPR